MAKLVEDLLKIRNEVIANLADLEDFGDRFNHLGCVLVFIVCTLVVTAKQYFLKPIACYMATESGGTNLLNYVENYCWVQGTIPVTYHGRMPQSEADWKALEGQKILYYQWVPFVLAVQCSLFYLPRLIWKTVCLHSGTRGGALSRVVLRAVEALHSPSDVRRGIIEEIADTVDNQIVWRMTMRARDSRCGCSCRREVNVIVAYVAIKLLYLVNAIGQLVMMQRFLGFNSTVNPAFGLTLLRDIAGGHDWQLTKIFPRVAYCYAPLKAFGVNSNAVTAQCVLPLNMLNEKIFIFLWWWILLAALVTAFFLFVWIFRFSTRNREVDYVTKYLDLVPNHGTTHVWTADADREAVSGFAKFYLRHEGMFLLRMVRLNAGEVVASQIAKALWTRYTTRDQQKLVGFGVVTPPVHPRVVYPMFGLQKREVDSSTQSGTKETNSCSHADLNAQYV